MYSIFQGLVNALETQFPSAEHRFRVMHLYKNLANLYKGTDIRSQLWLAAKANTDYWFDKHMGYSKKVHVMTLNSYFLHYY